MIRIDFRQSLLACSLALIVAVVSTGCPAAKQIGGESNLSVDASVDVDGQSPNDVQPVDSPPREKVDNSQPRQPDTAVTKESIAFDEPAGISHAGGLLYIADTNNHQIRTIDLNDDYRVDTLVIEGLEPPSIPPEPEVAVVGSTDSPDPQAIVDNDDPRKATPRPPTVAGDLDELDPAFPFRARFAWDEIDAQLPQQPDQWLNTNKPLKVSDFKGKFVMLDFWTYCCINCIHILPEIKKLERAYPNQLVVIGVHSAKFDTEKETENVRGAVLRYEIEHPVVNDIGSTVWQRIGVDSWPTVMLIDPEGNLVFLRKAEWTFEELDQVFQAALPYYREKNLLDEKPVKFDLLRDSLDPKPLNFPGKVLADEASKHLFIADSNHNRIVVSSLDGKLQHVIGTGAIGQTDGGFDEATFNKPQGMALLDDTLYVADTENHLLRKIDLAKQTVTTIAGTGEQGRNAWPGLDRLNRFAERPDRYVADPRTFAINSPWALEIQDDAMYIAMAGPHQIWRMSLDEKEIGPYAGNGREDIVDGPLLPETPYEESYSSFAQPSGLATDGQWLYVADSEGSSVRAVPFDDEKEVKTIVGSANLPFNRLFIFGDRDGAGPLQTSVPEFQWRGRFAETTGPALQHCLGVTHRDGKLYVADTYNNAIKMIDVESGTCTTIAGQKPLADAIPPK